MANTDRGSRLITLLQTLEKLNAQRGSRLAPEDLQQLRYTTSKILQYVTSQAGSDKKTKLEEKVHRDTIVKNPTYLDQLLLTLEYSGDTCTQQNLVYALAELAGKTSGSKRLSTLVQHGATHVLFQVLVYESKEETPSEELLISIHQLLLRLGPKDRKFGVKARLSQALGVTLHLLKTYINNVKLLLPIVHVLKLYAANAVNASYLGRSGAVSYIFKILSLCGRKHLTLVKYSLDTLALLVKTKSNSARAIGQGGVPVLLTMFYDWHRVDSKNRHVSLRKAILSTLKHITNLKSGRQALMEADGIRILYTCCQESIDCREVESLIVMASLIMRKCFPRNRLPICSLRSPLTCPVPESNFHILDTGEGQEMAMMNVIRHLHSGDDNGYESSVDNDDDISSDEDTEVKAESEDDLDELASGAPYKRSADELIAAYKQFFQEQHEFDIILEEESPRQSQGPQIVIPTADPNDYNTLSSETLHSIHARRLASRHSAPAVGGTDEELIRALRELKLPNYPSEFDLFQDRPPAYKPTGSRTRGGVYRLRDNTASDSEILAPAAINLKTGASVFSLDLPQRGSSKAANARSQQAQKPKKKTGKSKGTNGKKSRVKTKASEESSPVTLVPPVSIYPLDSNSSSGREASFNNDYSDDDNNDDEDTTPLHYLENPEAYAEAAAKTKSVGRFNKLAFPDMFGHSPPPCKEPLYEKKFGTQRGKIFEDIDRYINPEHVIDKVVYDMDAIVNTAGRTYMSTFSNHTNNDELRVSRSEDLTSHLKFNSQFESGNLRKVIQVRPYEYDLILNPDINTNHHHQWFYFEVSNMEAKVKYRFNIVNCEKVNSQLNFGMKPLLFSVTEALEGHPHWLRAGTEICYYKNHFVRSAQTTGGVKGKTYYTGTFTLTFKHARDVCYIAYHYPYTYSLLQYHLHKWESSYNSEQIYLKRQTLCETVSGNPIDVLTVTSHPLSYDREGVEQMKSRPYIFLTGRVHPGESNASWVMKGSIDFLLSDRTVAQTLRETYIFKIVPMLNPDGVINGNHRCSLVAEDLNRRWLHPCPKLHPSIYHSKGLLQYMQVIGKTPLVYCDYHGHSRRKNVFLYGCSPSLSWMTEDLNNPAVLGPKMEDNSYKTLARFLNTSAPAFSLSNCSYMVEKSKETTARVVVWREIGVVKSYTMESSYCGCDQGPYRGLHISTKELEEMGRKFCEALLKVKARPSRHTLQPYSIGPGADLDFSEQETADIAAGSSSDFERTIGAVRVPTSDSCSSHSRNRSSGSLEAELADEDDEEDEDRDEEDRFLRSQRDLDEDEEDDICQSRFSHHGHRERVSERGEGRSRVLKVGDSDISCRSNREAGQDDDEEEEEDDAEEEEDDEEDLEETLK